MYYPIFKVVGDLGVIVSQANGFCFSSGLNLEA